jgi:pantoate--beta-alanine ligase
MRLIETIPEMQETMLAWRRRADCRIGFVPTMGCLHEGHLSLIREVRRRGCVPVVSIFVNPIQFGPNEDFSRYPRPFEADCALCEKEGTEFLFAPPASAMYPADNSVFVEETRLSNGLCGASRPGHFRGVTTVVTKLFQIVQPHVAAFGRKDAQQARIIEHLAACLNMPVHVLVCPIVREADGLALSSRNKYLTPAERAEALCLVGALRAAAALYGAGERAAERLVAAMEERIAARSLARLEYAAIVDYGSLQPAKTAGPGSLFAVAARVGTTRLIDNLLINAAGESVL